MSELKITKEKVLEIAHTCNEAKIALKKLFPDCFNKTITEKIDGYESACKELNKPVLTIEHFSFLGKTAKMQFALEKITTIVEALNEGILPDPLKKQQRFYPYFLIDSSSGSGLVFGNSGYDDDDATTSSAARLGLKNRALSDFMGKNFIQDYAEFILNVAP